VSNAPSAQDQSAQNHPSSPPPPAQRPGHQVWILGGCGPEASSAPYHRPASLSQAAVPGWAENKEEKAEWGYTGSGQAGPQTLAASTPCPHCEGPSALLARL
jgi:hypothetical protein